VKGGGERAGGGLDMTGLGMYAALCRVTSSQASRSHRRRVGNDNNNKQCLQRGQTLIASEMFPHLAREYLFNLRLLTGPGVN